jgi:hypothetical protein
MKMIVVAREMDPNLRSDISPKPLHQYWLSDTLSLIQSGSQALIVCWFWGSWSETAR